MAASARKTSPNGFAPIRLSIARNGKPLERNGHLLLAHRSGVGLLSVGRAAGARVRRGVADDAVDVAGELGRGGIGGRGWGGLGGPPPFPVGGSVVWAWGGGRRGVCGAGASFPLSPGARQPPRRWPRR